MVEENNVHVEEEEEDWFESEKKEEERLAEERRQRRKRKLSEYNNNKNLHDEKEAEATRTTTTKQPSEPPILSGQLLQTEAFPITTNTSNTSKEEKVDDGNDSFDMFSSSPVATKSKEVVTTTSTALLSERDQNDVANFDDEEGYYKAHIGQTITLDHEQHQYKVTSIIGKGVFSTVLKCSVVANKNNSSSHEIKASDDENVVAIKLIRNKESMAKAAETEIQLLQLLKGKPHVVQYTQHAMDYHGHVAIALEYQPYTLRQVLNKFGSHVGIALLAVKSYFYQLLQALRQLQIHNIIHADIKPDNILINHSFSTLYLADFGSAYKNNITSTNSSTYAIPPTPYLVSRFYRAPEIILGTVHPEEAGKLDLWSVAITVAELFSGTVLLPGSSNNDMIFHMMTIFQKPFPKTMIRRHLSHINNHNITQHFSSQNPHPFQHIRTDKVTGQNVIDIYNSANITNNNKKQKEFHQLMMQAKSPKDDYGQVLQLIQLLQTCFTFDPAKRLTIQQALSHPFFTTAATNSTSNN